MTQSTETLDLSFDLNDLFDDLASEPAAASDEPHPHALDVLLASIADAEIRDLPLPASLLPLHGAPLDLSF